MPRAIWAAKSKIHVDSTPTDWIAGALSLHSFIDSASPVLPRKCGNRLLQFLVSCILSGWERTALRRLQTAALVPCRCPVCRTIHKARRGPPRWSRLPKLAILVDSRPSIHASTCMAPACRSCTTQRAVSHLSPLVLGLQQPGETVPRLERWTAPITQP